MSISDWLERNPRAADVLNEANAVKAGNSHRVVADAYDFSNIRTLTDVGGGFGTLMAEILVANPSMRGIVADLPSVIQSTRRTMRDRGIGDRCRAVECNFFEEVPSGSDAYLLSNILHDWPPDFDSFALVSRPL